MSVFLQDRLRGFRSGRQGPPEPPRAAQVSGSWDSHLGNENLIAAAVTTMKGFRVQGLWELQQFGELSSNLAITPLI